LARFDLRGSYVIEHGGPVREGEAEDVRDARYRGEFRDGWLELTIDLTADGTRLGPFAAVASATSDPRAACKPGTRQPAKHFLETCNQPEPDSFAPGRGGMP